MPAVAGPATVGCCTDVAVANAWHVCKPSEVFRVVSEVAPQAHDVLLEFFLTTLRRDGYEVLVSIKGREELDLANNQLDRQIDILLSDVSMPYMRGIELAKALRRTRPDIQVLFTSRMSQQNVLNRAGGLTRAEFLAKLFSVTGFADKVRAIAAAIGSSEDS